MSNNKPLGRKTDIVVQEMNGEVLIYDLKDNKAFCLNETSALVWQMCDGEKSVSAISNDLSKKLKSPINEDLIWLAIDQLKKENLIANGEELPNNFEGMNRRDVIKKVGLASMIALPVISGLVAPTAINAASVACDASPTTVNGVFQRGQGGFCRCTAAGSVTGQACTPNPDTGNPGDPLICRAGCTCTSTQGGTPNGTCQ